MLRTTAGPVREEEKLHNIYASPHTRVNKSRRMRWAGHVACMTDTRNMYKI